MNKCAKRVTIASALAAYSSDAFKTAQCEKDANKIRRDSDALDTSSSESSFQSMAARLSSLVRIPASFDELLPPIRMIALRTAKNWKDSNETVKRIHGFLGFAKSTDSLNDLADKFMGIFRDEMDKRLQNATSRYYLKPALEISFGDIDFHNADDPKVEALRRDMQSGFKSKPYHTDHANKVLGVFVVPADLPPASQKDIFQGPREILEQFMAQETKQSNPKDQLDQLVARLFHPDEKKLRDRFLDVLFPHTVTQYLQRKGAREVMGIMLGNASASINMTAEAEKVENDFGRNQDKDANRDLLRKLYKLLYESFGKEATRDLAHAIVLSIFRWIVLSKGGLGQVPDVISKQDALSADLAQVDIRVLDSEAATGVRVPDVISKQDALSADLEQVDIGTKVEVGEDEPRQAAALLSLLDQSEVKTAPRQKVMGISAPEQEDMQGTRTTFLAADEELLFRKGPYPYQMESYADYICVCTDTRGRPDGWCGDCWVCCGRWHCCHIYDTFIDMRPRHRFH